MNQTIRRLLRWLLELLSPEVCRAAAGYDRILGHLDQARWYLGKVHPEAGSLAQYLLDSEHNYNSAYLDEPRRDKSWTWQPPAWISNIDTYRDWLGTNPFGRVPARELDDLRLTVEGLERSLAESRGEKAALRSEVADAQAMCRILTQAYHAISQETWSGADRLAAESAIAHLSSEVARLRDRLEISHVRNGRGEKIPFPVGGRDGIACRDETIRGQDELISELRAETLERDERLFDLRAELEEVKNKLWISGGPALS